VWHTRWRAAHGRARHCCQRIQYRLQILILDTDLPERFFRTFRCDRCDRSYAVSRVVNPVVCKDRLVLQRWSEAVHRDVPGREDREHAGHALRFPHIHVQNAS
jgi:hypothetical protein